MADALLDAARATLDDALDALHAAVDGLTVEQLNHRLAGDGTNPVAVIATHALASTRSWLSLAMGAPPPERDRPAEFRVIADDGFPAWVDARIAECRALLAHADGVDLDRVGTAAWRPGREDESVTASWALLHAIGHLGEHVGHAQVMRDLLTA